MRALIHWLSDRMVFSVQEDGTRIAMAIISIKKNQSGSPTRRGLLEADIGFLRRSLAECRLVRSGQFWIVDKDWNPALLQAPTRERRDILEVREVPEQLGRKQIRLFLGQAFALITGKEERVGSARRRSLAARDVADARLRERIGYHLLRIRICCTQNDFVVDIADHLVCFRLASECRCKIGKCLCGDDQAKQRTSPFV